MYSVAYLIWSSSSQEKKTEMPWITKTNGQTYWHFLFIFIPGMSSSFIASKKITLPRLLCTEHKIYDNHCTGIHIPRNYLLENIMCLVVNVLNALFICLKQEVKFEMFIVCNLNLHRSFWSLNNQSAYICQGKSHADLTYSKTEPGIPKARKVYTIHLFLCLL